MTEAFARFLRPNDAQWFRGKARGLLIGIYTIGMLSPSIWIVFLAMLLVLPMMARSRSEGVALYVVAIASAPDLSFGLQAGSAYILDIDKWVCCSIGLFIVFVRFKYVGLKAGWRNDLPFWCQAIIQYTAMRDLNLTSTAREFVGTTLTAPMPYLMVSRSIGTMADLRRLMLTFTFTGFVLALVGVYESITRFFVYRAINGHLGIVGMDYRLFKYRSGFLRSMTVFNDNIMYAIFLSLAIMAALACRDMFSRNRYAVFAATAMALGILSTGSRNGFISLAISVVFYDLYRRRYLAMFGKSLLLGIAYAVAELLSEFVPFFSTMMGKSDDTAGSGDYRTLLLHRGLEEFWKHPWAGVSSKVFVENLRDLTQGEGIVDFVNTYIYDGLLVGFMGPILMLASFLIPCIHLLLVRRRMERLGPTFVRFAAFVFCSCISLAVSISLTSYGGRGAAFFYVILSVGVVLCSWSRLGLDSVRASDREYSPA